MTKKKKTIEIDYSAILRGVIIALITLVVGAWLTWVSLGQTEHHSDIQVLKAGQTDILGHMIEMKRDVKEIRNDQIRRYNKFEKVK